MRAMFPIGIKIKKCNHKMNIIAQLQTIFDKEINKFYLPLTKEPFDNKINLELKKEKKEKKEPKNKTKKLKK
jgi:hypothetical protein